MSRNTTHEQPTPPTPPTPQRWIMHIDMDAFFAAVEQLDFPEYRGKPLIIGGHRRGVVSTASYEARKFGVHSGMASSEARRRCPHGIFIGGRRGRYSEMSRIVHSVFKDFSPTVEMFSIDEGYVDATGMERVFGDVVSMGYALKDEVKRRTGGLTCSVGIAPLKFLAKICSDLNKPDGLYLLKPEDVPEFLDNLELRKVPGVGKQFCKELDKLGVKYGRDMLRYGEDFWERRHGKWGVALYRRISGLDESELVTSMAPKSESAEITLAEDTWDKEFLRAWLLKHAERVGRSLRKHNLAGRTVTLKIKYADFKLITRQTSLPERINSTQSIYEVGCKLLDEQKLANKVRLIGLGVSGFYDDKAHQLSLLGGANRAEIEEKRGKLDQALDEACARHGSQAVTRADLLGLSWDPEHKHKAR